MLHGTAAIHAVVSAKGKTVAVHPTKVTHRPYCPSVPIAGFLQDHAMALNLYSRAVKPFEEKAKRKSLKSSSNPCHSWALPREG